MKKFLRLAALILLFAVISASYLFLTGKHDSIYYVQTTSGEEVLCWDTGCGWNRDSTLTELHTTPPVVPAIVSKDIPHSEILVRQKIHNFKSDPAETYSALKGFVISDKQVAFAVRGFAESSVYVWDKQTKKSQLVTTSTNSLWPLELQPEGKLLLIGEYYLDRQRVEETIFNLSDSKKSFAMQLGSFEWSGADSYKGSEFLGFNAQLPTYDCPYFADINNCLANTRRNDYWNAFTEQRDPLDFNWISISLPQAWNYDAAENSIYGKEAVFTILSGQSKTNALAQLSECSTTQATRQGKSTNGKEYKATHNMRRPNCEDFPHEQLVIIRHGEFEESALVLSVLPIDSTATASSASTEISQLLASLSQSVLY